MASGSGCQIFHERVSAAMANASDRCVARWRHAAHSAAETGLRQDTGRAKFGVWDRTYYQASESHDGNRLNNPEFAQRVGQQVQLEVRS